MPTAIDQLLEEYQEFTKTTALYPQANTGHPLEIVYLGLGLMGEYEEWSQGNFDIKEAGDILWYCSQLCNVYNRSLVGFDITTDAGPSTDKPNLSNSLKKLLRDNKDVERDIIVFMRYVLTRITWRYKYFNSAYTVEEGYIKTIQENIKKLSSRKERGVLQGDGDDR
ncbi:MAG: hypothetical protein H3Z50_07715 [archaeon]|nr:hypothetical protein [archaeon]